jgi:hypothetical protein
MNARRAPPDDVTRGFEHAFPGWRIARVEIAVTAHRTFAHEIDVFRRVKVFELVACRRSRRRSFQAPIEPCFMQLAHEHFMPIRTERVTVPEPVARNVFARDQQHRGVVGCVQVAPRNQSRWAIPMWPEGNTGTSPAK